MPSAASSPTTWEAYARELGTNLLARRKQMGLTQEDLAHRAGMTRTHYQQIERGMWKPGQPANPSIQLLARLAQQLDSSPADLLPDVAALDW